MAPYIHIYIPGYALFVAVGVFFSLCVIYQRNQKYKFNLKELLFLAVANVAGVVLGSKFLFILTKLPELFNEFSFSALIKLIITSGFVFYGGLLGAMLFTMICCAVLRTDRTRVFNFLTPAYLVFHACGRIGCFLAGCCYGKESEIGFVMADGVCRFPIQLVECGCNLLILCGIIGLEKREKGLCLVRVYLLAYSLCRFLLEFLRGDEIRGIWAGISTSQWISIAIFSVVSVLELRKLIINQRERVTEV